MNMTEAHFDFLIGSATLDIYNPKEGGLMLQVDSTHGYHRHTIHLATRYPRIIATKSNILTLLPNCVWLAIGVSITALTIAILTTILVYSNISSSLLCEDIDVTRVIIRLFAGITEPDNENWFTVFSTGSF